MSYYNSKGEAMTQSAFFALLAAKKRKDIGRFAASRYYQRKTGNTSLRLYILACQLLAVEEAKQREAEQRRSQQDRDEATLMQRATSCTQASNLLDFLTLQH